MGIIYKATFPNEKVYIGQSTRSLQMRITEHRYNMNNNDSRIVYKAMRKYGFENIIWDVIEDNIDDELLDEREIYWIKYFNSYFENGKGYNMTYGGDSYKNRCLVDSDSELAKEIYEKYKECGSTPKIGEKYGFSTNMINNLLTRIDENWKQYSQIGRGHTPKYSEEEDLEIYEYYKRIGKTTIVADYFNTDRATIVRALKRVDQNYKQYENKTKFTNEQIDEIRNKFKEGVSIKGLGREYNSSWETISNIVK